MSLLQGLSKRLWGMFKSDLRVYQSASRQQFLSALLGRGHRRSEELHNGIDCQRGCLPGMRRYFHGCLKKMSLQRRVQRRMPMWRRLQLPGIRHGNVPGSNLLYRKSSELYLCVFRGWQLPGHDFQKMMIVNYILSKESILMIALKGKQTLSFASSNRPSYSPGFARRMETVPP